MNLIDNYLDALTRTLARFDGVDDLQPVTASGGSALKKLVVRSTQTILAQRGCEVVRRHKFDAEKRTNGRDRPFNADTMIGIKRLDNIRYAVRTIIEDDVPGDLVETGVWRGGGSIMMRAALLAYGDQTRRVWCADSFEGLPAPDLARFPQDDGMVWHTESELAISLETVRQNFAKHNLLDDRVHFLKGWFKDTLPTAPIDRIAVLRLDGDLYASTMDALNPLYDKVSPGGFVIVDDYGIPEDTCRAAINDFRSQRGIADEMHDIDGWGCYWRKSAASAPTTEMPEIVVAAAQ